MWYTGLSGKSLNDPEAKDFIGTRTKKETKEISESDKKTRLQTSSTINLRSRTKWWWLIIINYYINNNIIWLFIII